ncbi:MAG: T9SS type A sorting domain-containing protein [Bacteroidota bacterium]|nr:T9SS type A sorting domain-containing protein [Bacteroidota bacterium]MDP4191330.1 T9SS type A sorting domain-containing protein [Bacteroidota bacterium]MDP4195809.1 T9SS type A sorting domain-containing protein [Bacteroidota bacterium]
MIYFSIFKTKPTRLFFIFLLLFSDLKGQYPNIKVNTRNNSPNEVSIAINPLKPLNLAAGANIASVYYSEDGGKSWKDTSLVSPEYGVWGDPSLTYDAAGNLYFAHLSNPKQNGYWIDRIVVQKSTDGGKSFDKGIGIGYNPPRKQQDKEWITADISNSQYKNNLYLSWTEFDKYGSTDPKDSSRILFSRSTNGGKDWSMPQTISDTSGDCLDSDNTVEGAVPAVGPSGEIYISWAGKGGIKFDKSTDGGKTFGKDVYVTSQPGGWDFHVAGIYRANGLPVTLCDISNSPHRGNIYINWSDQRNGHTEVYLIRSTDGGNSWEEVKQVKSITEKGEHFFPWAAVDQKTGTLWITYYSRGEISDSATDLYVSKSTDGGLTFSSFKVSQSSFTPNPKVFFGDYINIAANNGKIYPIWMRLDGNELSIWTSIIDESATKVEGDLKGFNFYNRLEQNFPNPFNPSTYITYSIARSGFITLRIYNILGKIVTELVNGVQNAGRYTIRFSDKNLPSGIYFYRLSSGEFSSVQKMLLIR